MDNGLNLRRILRLVALIGLPEPIAYRLLHYHSRRDTRSMLAREGERWKLSPQENVILRVHWADVPNVGRGPSASLFVLEEEVLRLDCFGGRQGHMHLNPMQQRYCSRLIARLFFPEGPRSEQVDRAAFELVTNYDAALKSNRLSYIRNFSIDRIALADAARQMKLLMQETLQAHDLGAPAEVDS